MRLPVWKRKSMLSQADVQETSTQAQSAIRRDIFLRLMQQFEPALRRLTSGYAHQPADREDLFQEIAVGLWRAIPGFRGDATERTWLYRIAHNIAISASTRLHNRAKNETAFPDDADVFRSTAIDSEQAVLQSEKQDQLAKAIRSLPIFDRQLILLHLEGLSYAQIEEISGLSQSAIAARLSRLRDRLRDIVFKPGRASHAQ